MKKMNIIMLILGLVFIVTGCNLSITYSDTIISLDTQIDISFRTSKNGKQALKDIKDIFKKVDKYSDNYNSHNNQSIKDLNDHREIELNDELKPIIEAALDIKEDTNGYYNPLIGRLSKLWKNAIKNEQIVDDSIVADELEIMNNSEIVIDGNNVKIIGDADVDLGGIAKGYATEKVHQYFIDNNITEYLIDAGESNILVGTRKKGYNVGFSKPFDNSLYGAMKLTDKSIGTSSPRYQSCKVGDELIHHLLSPYTGKPVNYYESVNVICDDSMVADAYSTAIFAMDLDTLKDFVNSKGIQVIACKNSEIIYKKVDGEFEEV